MHDEVEKFDRYDEAYRFVSQFWGFSNRICGNFLFSTPFNATLAFCLVLADPLCRWKTIGEGDSRFRSERFPTPSSVRLSPEFAMEITFLRIFWRQAAERDSMLRLAGANAPRAEINHL